MLHNLIVFNHMILTEDEIDSVTIQVAPDIGPTVKSNTLSLMEASIAALSRELSKIRTGRASTGSLYIFFLMVAAKTCEFVV